ncbi:DUF4129 domain-containing protein [Janibacter sp. GS2]|uniref:DUF4129 domain-containing protein n=1 Tax=Janibacter sp. GS2 TaxID=3442646 RepID=UPI003EBAA55E
MRPSDPGAEGPPLTPDSPEARDWLERELATPTYQDEQGLLGRLLEWIVRQLGGGPVGAVPGPVLWALLLVVVVTVTVVAVRALRRNPTSGPAGEGEIFADARPRTAQEHRRAARAAMAAGEHDRAVLEAFRGMARDGVERTLVPESPGVTVHEVVVALTRAFPAKGEALAFSAATFDDVRYGDTHTDAATVAVVVTLGEELVDEHAVLPDIAAVAGECVGGAR